MYQKIVLDNGLRLIASEMPHARSASVTVFLGVGSRCETKSTSGISHFIEHMLFKGTEKRPTGKEICEAIEAVGGILNAETGKEMTVYWAKVASANLPLALDVISDFILDSKFQASEIEKERRVIIEEINMLADTPNEQVDILFDEVLWGDQPLGRDIAGTKESVNGITRAQIVEFIQRYYSPANTVVSIAGPFGAEHVAQLVSDKFGQWQSAAVSNSDSVNEPTPGPRLKLEYKKTEQAHLCLGVPSISYFHPDRFAIDLLNVILGEGMSSRLFQELRERRGLAYDVHSYVHHFRDVGSTVVYAGVEPKKATDAIKALLEQLELLKKNIPEAELIKAKELWKGSMILRLEDTRSIASWVGGQELLLNKILNIDDMIKIIDNISGESLNRIARDIFSTDKLHLSVVGPFRDESKFAELLRL